VTNEATPDRPEERKLDVVLDAVGHAAGDPHTPSLLLSWITRESIVDSMLASQHQPAPEFLAEMGEVFAETCPPSPYGEHAAIPAKTWTPLDHQHREGRDRLAWMYERRYDRYAVGAFAVLASWFAVSELGGPSRLSALAVLAGAANLLFLAYQSGRIGYLSKKNWNHLDDMVASLPTSIIRGSRKVCEAEQALVNRARKRVGARLLIADLWSQPRKRVRSPEFDALQREITAFAKDAKDEASRLEVAVTSTPPNWKDCEPWLRERTGRASQRFFLENPLQVDAVITDTEAVLTFARPDENRNFALHFRNRAVVSEFLYLFDAYLGQGSSTENIKVDGDDELERARRWMLERVDRPSLAARRGASRSAEQLSGRSVRRVR